VSSARRSAGSKRRHIGGSNSVRKLSRMDLKMEIIRKLILPAIVVAAMTLLTTPYALAKGGYVRPPPIEDLGDSAHISDKFLFNASLGELLSGCGTRRYYDTKAQMCRGPADD
jgi:hypothetical protein